MTVGELLTGCCSSVEMKMLFDCVTNYHLKCLFSEEVSSLSISGSTPTSLERRPGLHPSSMGAGKPYS